MAEKDSQAITEEFQEQDSLVVYLLLDTNIVIEHLTSKPLPDLGPDAEFAISVVTEAELLRLAGMPHSEEQMIRDFISATKVFPLDSSIARRAAELGRTRKTALDDLFIAATALDKNIRLITKNLRDFKNIPDLDVRGIVEID